jgi:TrkA domain protein
MPEVSETQLPGVGVRHEFTTGAGERIAVVTHRTGRREIAVYDSRDPDASRAVLHFSQADARTLAELLGASPLSETVAAVQQELEGLAIDWVTIAANSPVAGATIAEGAFRTRTGVSIVAVVRGKTTVPAPEPGFRFEAGDVAVAVGTAGGLAEFRSLLGG